MDGVIVPPDRTAPSIPHPLLLTRQLGDFGRPLHSAGHLGF